MSLVIKHDYKARVFASSRIPYIKSSQARHKPGAKRHEQHASEVSLEAKFAILKSLPTILARKDARL